MEEYEKAVAAFKAKEYGEGLASIAPLLDKLTSKPLEEVGDNEIEETGALLAECKHLKGVLGRFAFYNSSPEYIDKSPKYYSETAAELSNIDKEELTDLKEKFKQRISDVDEDLSEVNKTKVSSGSFLSHVLTEASDESPIILTGDRRLGYKTFGAISESPTSSTSGIRHILLLHGTPGSRSFCLPVWEKFAVENQIRFHVVERPGFGLSESHPKESPRTLVSFVRDLEEYSEIMNLPSFYILGYSAGSPFAAVASVILPEKKLSGVAFQLFAQDLLSIQSH